MNITLLMALFLSPSTLFAQDAYTKLRERYLENELSEHEYAADLRSLYQRLRAGEYQSEQDEMAIKCMFPVRAEIISRLNSLEKAAFLDHEPRPLTQASYKTESGNFIIHYDTTGTHAVELNYTLGKTVPDWIHESGLAYEWARHLLIDSLGYREPAVDSVEEPEQDVYIQQLSGQFYGFIVSDQFEDTVNTSYIMMDNDYVESSYFSRGLDGMRVTAVHEYFHSVQLAYNFRSQDRWFFELASTWFEDVGYDEVNDYVNYIGSYYRTTSRSLFSSNGFSAAIFGKFLEENYNIGIMRSIWEFIVDNSATTSIDMALKLDVETTDGLKAAFGKFALWTWFTGSRSINGVFFEEAFLYPGSTLVAEVDTFLSDAIDIPPLIGLDQLAFRLYRFTPTRSLDIKATFSANNKQEVWGSTMTAQPPLIISLPSGVSTNAANVSSSSGLIIAAANGSFKISDEGRERYSISVRITSIPPDSVIALYPNPLEYDADNTTINISYEITAAINSGFFIVYDLLGRTVYREELGMLSQGVNSLTYSPDIRLSSGIYLYQITGDGVKISGKFTLLR
ncbi:T9SS type A sorting domain-containing protein [Candidatus Marinimicrobia bacterium MT.SAG.2]|nr:T9SS type A sorting domain-containing protein [Candidatus Marinimicrobia bacterium MT.SAG.2]